MLQGRATVFDARGAYTGQPKELVTTVLSGRELTRLRGPREGGIRHEPLLQATYWKNRGSGGCQDFFTGLPWHGDAPLHSARSRRQP
ncbi:MAG: DUF2179 domain-containing protein [Bacillota bacterium]